VQTIGTALFGLRRYGLVWTPEDHNVVVIIGFGGDLHKLHRTASPIANGLYPQTRAAFVLRLQIVIVDEAPVPLQETEATRIVVKELANLQRLGMGQGPPEPFSPAVPDRQAIGVVHGGAHVINAGAVIGAKDKHTGQWRQASAL
jgi:hypothetical protein